MSIRLPLGTAATFTDSNEVGAGSVAGGVPHLFVLPQDTDNILVKFSASLVGGASAILQTTDDGGTTWYDLARTSIVSNTPAGLEEWMSVPVIGFGGGGVRASLVATGSVIAVGNSMNTIGNSAAASTLAQKTMSGLPVLSPTGRIFIVLSGNITSATANLLTTEINVNSQSATA